MISREHSVKLFAAAAAVSAVALVSACGSDDDSSHDHHDHTHAASSAAPASGATTAVSAEKNSADVMFAQMMIPHHEQAVEMAALVPSRTQNAWLRALASKISSAQQPEIDQLTAALKSWNEPLSMGHGGHQMDGMMTDEQMAHLKTLSGDAFDREWLTMMIAHHEGAVDMAKTELADGKNPQMKAMAQSIVDSQQKEIDEMRAHLK
ncbi:MAG: DUF305 domain-containing protein [Gordonia sp. (in: high G+C Gram-positive bacteria)]